MTNIIIIVLLQSDSNYLIDCLSVYIWLLITTVLANVLVVRFTRFYNHKLL